MTLDASQLESSWAAALARPPVTRFRTAEVGVDTPHGPVLAAVQDDGVRHLLVPIDPRHTLKEDLAGSAVTLRRRVLEDEASYGPYAALALVDDQLDDLYTALCVEIVARIAATPTRAVAALHRALADWRALLAGARRVLTPSALAGLFGELHVLRTMTALDPGAVAFWTGPTGSAQDFHRTPDALEVKTTTLPEGRTIRVHGVDQLDVAPPGRLSLTWMRLRTDRGVSVPDLVDDLLESVDDRSALLDALTAVGYRPVDREIYSHRLFEIVEQRSYVVEPGFPRIVAAGLTGDAVAAGIGAIQYEVDLDSAAAEARRLAADPIADFLGNR